MASKKTEPVKTRRLTTKKPTAKPPKKKAIKKPRIYSETQKDNLCAFVFQEMAIGHSVRAIFRDNASKLPIRYTFEKWVKACEDRKGQYTRAKEERAIHIFEEIFEIADDSKKDYTTNDQGKEVLNNEHVQRSRLRIDARKWALSKMMPDKFGDRVTLEGDTEKPFTVIHLGGEKK